jgi:pilus assembly protein CpaB
MARMRVTLVMLVALAAGGGLAYGTYDYMQKVPVKTVSLPTRAVVVAAADLELGSELRADDLRVVDWPASSVPAGAFERADDVIGRGLGDAGHPERADPADEAGVAEAGAGLPIVIPEGCGPSRSA